MQIPAKAFQNWDNLKDDPEKQFAIALRVVERRTSEWQKQYPTVASVSVGYKNPETGEEANKEVCLRFEVQKKIRSPGEAVPQRVLGYHDSETGRMPISIPTDVYQTSSSKSNDSIPADYFYGYGRFNGQFKREPGSACCVFKLDYPDETGGGSSGLALLSCAHVFNLVKKNSFRALKNAAVFRKVPNGGDHQVGRTFANGPFNASPDPKTFTLDASLTKIAEDVDADALADMTDPLPTALADQGITHAELYVSGVWGKDRVRFLGYVPRRKFRIGPGVYIRVRGAYMYASQKTPDPEGIRPGYSGSPLIDSQGRIYGMHFYGGERDERGNTLGYALPIMDVIHFFESNYGFKMHLVTI